MKQQISNRLGVAHVRDTMMQFVTGAITRQQAMESLQVGQSQLYSLRTSYLAARAQGRGDGWEPGSSGGNRLTVGGRVARLRADGLGDTRGASDGVRTGT